MNTKGNRIGHKCDEKFCHICHSFHTQTRGFSCFIQTLDPPKPETVEYNTRSDEENSEGEDVVVEPPNDCRFVVFDVESTQDVELTVVNEESGAVSETGRFPHTINFISAMVMCTQCIREDQWSDESGTGGCKICGAHRTLAWSCTAFSQTPIGVAFVDADPLLAFLRWLLYVLDKNYQQVVLSHYGGR